MVLLSLVDTEWEAIECQLAFRLTSMSKSSHGLSTAKVTLQGSAIAGNRRVCERFSLRLSAVSVHFDRIGGGANCMVSQE
jgi:hypothetical protein